MLYCWGLVKPFLASGTVCMINGLTEQDYLEIPRRPQLPRPRRPRRPLLPLLPRLRRLRRQQSQCPRHRANANNARDTEPMQTTTRRHRANANNALDTEPMQTKKFPNNDNRCVAII
jgi:hypothetical protein